MKKTLLIASIFICQLASAQEVLTLEDCLQMSETFNPYIRNANLDILASKALKSELTWEYFPSLSMNVIGFRAQDPLLQIGPEDIFGTTDNARVLNNAYLDFAGRFGLKTNFDALGKGYGAAFLLVQPIYAGGRIRNGNALAAMGVEASQLQADMKARDISLEVEEKYWLAVALQEKTVTLDRACSVLDSLYRYVCAARDAGLVAASEAVEVKQRISELATGRVKLRGGLKLAKMDLFNFIGFEYEYLNLDNYFLSGDLGRMDSVESISAMGEALPIESRLLEIQQEAKTLEKKVAVGELLPEVGVGISYGYGNFYGNTGGQFNGVGFVSVKIPITGIGKAAARARRLDYEIQKVSVEKEYLEAQLVLQRHQLLLAVETAAEQAGLSESFMEDAEDALQRCEGNYKAGRATLADLLQAELQCRTATEQHIDDCIEYRKAVSAFERRYGPDTQK